MRENRKEIRTIAQLDEYFRKYWDGILGERRPINNQAEIYPFLEAANENVQIGLKGFKKEEPELLSSVSISIAVHSKRVAERDRISRFLFGYDFEDLYKELIGHAFNCDLTESQITYRNSKRFDFLQYVRRLHEMRSKR